MKNKIDLFETILNDLVRYEIDDLKIVYVKKEKSIDTITKESIKNKTIYEDGYSISFNINNQYYFVATDSISNDKEVKRKIYNLIKKHQLKKKKKKIDRIYIDFSMFKEKETPMEYFNLINYQNDINVFIEKKNEIMDIRIPLLRERKKTYIITPNSNTIYKEENYYKMDIIMNIEMNGKNRFNYFSMGCSTKIDDVKGINVSEKLNELFNVMKKMKSHKQMNQKCDIVLSNGIGGLLFHETCGHSLESREIIKKSSIMNNVKKIKNKRITLIDNPKIKNEFGSFQIDDEGNYPKRIELIKSGKIMNYLCDTKGKKLLDQEASSCRRESYYHLFSSRMSNTYIEEGKEKFEDIILSVQDGYFIKNILGGVVDTLSGNFSFNCIEAYKINNGKIDDSICYDNLTIVGNTMSILDNTDKIGNDLKLASGICGSDSGFIYTTVGQPTIKIKDIMVVS